MTVTLNCRRTRYGPRFHGHLKPSLMPLIGVLKITPHFHGHLEASLKPLSQWCDQAYAAHRNTRNPRSAVRAGRRNALSQILQQFELSRPNRQRTSSRPITAARLRGDWSIWTQGRRRRYRPAPLLPSAGRRGTQTCKLKAVIYFSDQHLTWLSQRKPNVKVD